MFPLVQKCDNWYIETSGDVMKRVWSLVGQRVAVVIGIAVLVAPIGVYMYKYGAKVPSEANLWGALGSAMSGIYGPILTVFTLVVLGMQVRLQHAQLKLQQTANQHTSDQAELQNAKDDINFYLEQLVKALEKSNGEGGTIKGTLHRSFERKTVEELSNMWVRRDARTLHDYAPQLQEIWMPIYLIYNRLSSRDETSYQIHYNSARQKAIAMLSYPTCVALDNYLYCLTEDRIRYAYQFSPALSAPSRSTAEATAA